MTEVVILQDVAGYPKRVQALRDAHPNVIACAPDDFTLPGVLPFSVPAEWISADTSIPYRKRCWLRAGIIGLAAARQHAPDADFVWFIESDCVASQDRWKAMFKDHRNNPADCLSNPARERSRTLDNGWWTHPGTPEWASCFFISACYRLSSRAIAEGIRCAEETRECFAELALPSILRRAGLTMESVNQRQTHWNRQCFRVLPEKVILNPALLNHPVKENTYGPS